MTGSAQLLIRSAPCAPIPSPRASGCSSGAAIWCTWTRAKPLSGAEPPEPARALARPRGELCETIRAIVRRAPSGPSPPRARRPPRRADPPSGATPGVEGPHARQPAHRSRGREADRPRGQRGPSARARSSFRCAAILAGAPALRPGIRSSPELLREEGAAPAAPGHVPGSSGTRDDDLAPRPVRAVQDLRETLHRRTPARATPGRPEAVGDDWRASWWPRSGGSSRDWPRAPGARGGRSRTREGSSRPARASPSPPRSR